MEIPNIIKQEASKQGFNSVEYLASFEGQEVFGLSRIGEDGRPEPTGLPTLLLLKEGVIEKFCGTDAMELCRKLGL